MQKVPWFNRVGVFMQCTCFFIFSSFLFAILPRTVCGQESELFDFLQNTVRLSQKELSKIKRGQAVVKLLDSSLRREVGVFGIVRIVVPGPYFVQQYHGSDIFVETLNAVEKGEFHNPPMLQDVQGSTLEESDVKAIERCKPGDCDIKMSAESMAHFQRKINWRAPDAKQQTENLFRHKMVQYVASYLIGGNSAMAEFDDQKYPLRLVDEFEDLLKKTPYLYIYAPELHKYLLEYPEYELPGVEDFVYWSKDDIGAKRPVIAITHVTIYKPLKDSVFDVLIASKKIYASHYFEAGLGLTAFADDPENSGQAFYFLFLNRSRIDVLRHPHFGGILRKKIRGGLRNLVKENLQTIKSRTESTYQVGM